MYIYRYSNYWHYMQGHKDTNGTWDYKQNHKKHINQIKCPKSLVFVKVIIKKVVIRTVATSKFIILPKLKIPSLNSIGFKMKLQRRGSSNTLVNKIY